MRVGDANLRDGKLSTDPVEKLSTKDKEREQRLRKRRGRTMARAPSPSILRGLGREVDRGETLVRERCAPGGGQDLGNGELLALQAGVYRYSEAVDLSAKLVDRAASGVEDRAPGPVMR